MEKIISTWQSCPNIWYSLVGLFRTLCGDRERDAAACDDYSGLVSSRVSYMASTVVFGTVLADAALVSRVIQIDACGAPPARFAAPASARHGPRAGAPLTQRDVEGEGGSFGTPAWPVTSRREGPR